MALPTNTKPSPGSRSGDARARGHVAGGSHKSRKERCAEGGSKPPKRSGKPDSGVMWRG